MTEAVQGDQWIDDVADRFEETSRMGQPSPIEEFLEGQAADDRAALLEELICIEVRRRRGAGEEPAQEEYLARFPADHEAVEAGFLAAALPTPASETERVFPPAGVQLLIGVLALQHKFVNRQALQRAFEAWADDKSRGLGEILVENGDLSAVRLAVLESLAAQTLGQCNGDLNRALAARDALESMRGGLERFADADLSATVTKSARRDPSTTDDRLPTADGYRLASVQLPEARYRLVRRINRGGQGDIFLAVDRALNREVAIKRLQKRYAYSPEFQARLLLEAEVAARLEHPSFLPVYFAGFDVSGRPYFVMRYIEGDSSLKSRIQEFHSQAAKLLPDEHAQGLRKLLRHFVDVCYAIAYAHDRGVVHRDIKPANVLVGHFGETYVVDWGMVKFTGRPVNADPQAKEPLIPARGLDPEITIGGGTLLFMSPEQIDRLPLTPATDVYSLGVTLYVLLTGQDAYSGSSREEIEDLIRRGEYRKPREVESRVPPALEAVCEQAIKRRPEDRYAGAKELARDIEDWLADRPIAVYPEPWPQRARRWARNHRPAVVGLSVLLITSILSLIVSGVLLMREQARTELNFGLARNAVLRLVQLARIPPRSKETRDQIARIAIDDTRKFVASRPRDPAVRLELAKTYRAIANIGRAVGEFDTPQSLYSQGADLLNSLRAEFPTDTIIAEEQALNAIDTGELWLVNGQPAQSKVFFEQGLGRLGIPGKSLSDSQKKVKALALLNLTTAHNQTGEEQKAQVLGTEAVALLESLAPDAAGPADEALLLAHLELGAAGVLLGNTPEADRSFTKAIDQGEALIRAGNDTPQVKYAFAQALRSRAETRAADPTKFRQAVEQLNEASQIFHTLVAEHPHVPLYHRAVAISCIDWADILLAQKHTGEQTEKMNAGAQEELGLYAGQRELFDYHGLLGRVMAQRARLAAHRNDIGAARNLYDQAIDELAKALAANAQSKPVKDLQGKVLRERAMLR